MLITHGPHRTFKKRTTTKGVPRQSSYTMSTREKRRAQERQARKEKNKGSTGKTPIPTPEGVSSPATPPSVVYHDTDA